MYAVVQQWCHLYARKSNASCSADRVESHRSDRIKCLKLNIMTAHTQVIIMEQVTVAWHVNNADKRPYPHEHLYPHWSETESMRSTNM